jgi:hypothetical protein
MVSIMSEIYKVKNNFILILGIFLVALIFYSCDFSIQNPGPIEDEQLNNPETFSTLINGMKKTFANAQNNLAYTGAAAAKEITAAGGIGTYGITLAERKGNLASSEGHVNEGWNVAQEARWVAEDGVRRMREQLGNQFSSNKFSAEGLIWSGYANRLLGDNMCKSVIDGGSAGNNSVYFERSEEAFTEAISILNNLNDNNLLFAAYAGRASARVFLDNWEGAVSDANEVPINFVFVSERSDIKTTEYNQFYWGNANEPYRAHSVVDTYYEDYYKEYNDPRVSWDTDSNIPFGVGRVVKWLFQTKYTKKSSPMNISDGHEMVLIRAEAKLRSGNWQEALNLINSIRKKVGVKSWQASNEEEAWTRLKRERGIELWLEARRLGDLRRWTEENTPGVMEDMTGRDLCFSIGQDEIEANDNLN